MVSVFRENKAHLQNPLFSHYHDLNPSLQKRLAKSWAPVFYEHVFAKVDETPFAVLYCADNGRPNFPVNISVALELIKHWKDLTDEELIEQASFNFLVNYAVGLKNLGEDALSPRTLYEFRSRVYQHAITAGPDADLIFEQFSKITQEFLELTGAKVDAQRMDSTFIVSNIQKAGRLALAFDVLYHAVKDSLDESLPEELKEVLTPNFKTALLYKTKGNGLHSRLESILALGGKLLEEAAGNPWEKQTSIELLKRFLSEQGSYDAVEKRWKAKPSGEISSDSLQSAHDADATYRKKQTQSSSGYVCNIAETCSRDNLAQFITAYEVEKNITADTTMLEECLPALKEAMPELKDLYVDGGYYSQDVVKIAEQENVTMHFTDMTGGKGSDEKLPCLAFAIQNQKIIIACPAGHAPEDAAYKEKKEVLSAHFDRKQCLACPMLAQCPIKIQKKMASLHVSRKKLVAESVRATLKGEARIEATRMRAGIEGTNSALKQGQGLGELEVRGLNKSRTVVGFKMIGHNFGQLLHWLRRQAAALAKAAQTIKDEVLPQAQGTFMPG